MTSTPDPSATTGVHPSDHDVAAAAARAANKAAVFAALASAGIAHVTVHFDGEGDSGQIEGIEASVNGELVDLPTDQVEIAKVRWYFVSLPSPMLLGEAIEELTYACLDQVDSGWEINDGAYGYFEFDVAAQTITLELNARFTDVDTSQHTF